MEEKYLPQIKIYKIDYDFIIKNYTNPRLWDKVWNLFIYKNYIYTLQLDSIDVKNKKIKFEVKLSSNLDIWNNYKTTTIDYRINNMTIENLKQYINSAMISLIKNLESEYIEYKDINYKNILDARQTEQDLLREIAEDFLDENGVTNTDIRDVYIDYYVDNNEQTWEKLSIYKDSMKYNYLTDLYLIVAEAINNFDLKEEIINQQNNDISNIIEEVEEFIQYMETEEYVEEMQEKLEGI